MIVALALRSVVAAAVIVAPAETVPVQRPTVSAGATSASATTPVGTPSSTVVPAPGRASGWDSRGYTGIEDTAGIAAPPPSVEVAPPPTAEPAPSTVTLVTPVPSTPPEPPPEPEVEGPLEDEGPAYDPLVDSPEAIRARKWVHAGIVFTVVGGVLTIGGIAMSTAKVNVPGAAGTPPCDPREDRAGNGCQPDGRDRSVAALVIPGSLLLLGGAAMLIVGKRQQARLRAGLQADRRGFMIGASLRF